MSRDRADEIVGVWLNLVTERPASPGVTPEVAECLKAFEDYARNMKPPRRFTFGRVLSRIKRKAKA